MRFGRVLHPEVLLGKRGDEAEREFFAKALSITDLKDGGLIWKANENDIPAQAIARLLREDSVFVRLMVNSKKFIEENASVYHVGQDFLTALQKIDRKIPVDILPEKFCGYFSFASNTVFDEDNEILGGYVCIDFGRNLAMPPQYADTRVITFVYICKAESVNSSGPVGSLSVPLESKTIADLYSEVPSQDFGYMMNKPTFESEEVITGKRNDVFRTLLNCVIYLHSDEPILERSIPLSESKKTAKQHKLEGAVINSCTIPVYFLHPNYQLPKNYRVNSTWVDSFPRWQRCGPKLSQVKLVFVKGFERKFNIQGEPCANGEQRN